MSGRFGRASQRSTGWSSNFAANSVISSDQGALFGTNNNSAKPTSANDVGGNNAMINSQQGMRNAEMAKLYANDVDAPQQQNGGAQQQYDSAQVDDAASSLSETPPMYSTSGATYENECSQERQNILVAGLSFIILALIMFQSNQPDGGD